MNKTVELCQFCESEVELLEELRLQECPNCKNIIMPCTYCNDLDYNCDFRWLNDEKTKGLCRHREEEECKLKTNKNICPECGEGILFYITTKVIEKKYEIDEDGARTNEFISETVLDFNERVDARAECCECGAVFEIDNGKACFEE